MAHIELITGGPERPEEPDIRRNLLRESSQLIQIYSDFCKVSPDEIKFSQDSRYLGAYKREIERIQNGDCRFLRPQLVNDVVWKDDLSSRVYGRIIFDQSFHPFKHPIPNYRLTDNFYYMYEDGQLQHAVETNPLGEIIAESLFLSEPVEFFTTTDTFSQVPLLELRDGFVTWNYREAQRIRQDEY